MDLPRVVDQVPAAATAQAAVMDLPQVVDQVLVAVIREPVDPRLIRKF